VRHGHEQFDAYNRTVTFSCLVGACAIVAPGVAVQVEFLITGGWPDWVLAKLKLVCNPHFHCQPSPAWCRYQFSCQWLAKSKARVRCPLNRGCWCYRSVQIHVLDLRGRQDHWLLAWSRWNTTNLRQLQPSTVS